MSEAAAVREGAVQVTTSARGLTSAGSIRPLVVGMVTVAIVGACIQPVSTTDLGRSVSFMPATLALVAALDVMSAALLVRQFRDAGDRRALALALAYVFSLTVMAGYGAAFPGVLGDTGPLGGWPSTAPWLWVVWHTAFPLLLAAAVVPWPRGWDVVEPEWRRRLVAWGVLAGSVLVGSFLVLAATFGRGWLPVVIQGVDTTAMTRVAGPVAIPLSALATIAAVVGALRLAGPMRWASLAAVAALADMTVTLFSFHRFTLGWYAGRGMTVIASGVVLIAMLAEFNKLRRRVAEEAHLLRLTLERTEELEAIHATLLDHMPDGVVLQDQDGRVVASNKSAAAMLGLTTEKLHREAPGVWEGRLLSPDGSPWSGETPDRIALATGETQRDEIVGLSLPDGNRRWMRVNSTCVRTGGSGIGYVVSSMTDETERYEARLLARELNQQKRRRVRAVLEAPEALAMVVQPIVDLRTGSVVGGEALSRFQGPPHQGPDVWFADAEDVGLSLDLELLAVRRAISELQGVPDNAYLSMNVSPAAATTDALYALLSVDREAAGRIVLELTEHTSVADYPALQKALQRLRRLGVRVAVDDAGSGFASLRHILKLEPDFVKLDLDLVRNIDQDPARRALAAGLLTFASQIGAKLIGEGIENEPELAALLEVGVIYGQGYHLGRPAPAPLPMKVRVPNRGTGNRR